jgi:hypothetical protein
LDASPVLGMDGEGTVQARRGKTSANPPPLYFSSLLCGTHFVLLVTLVG